MRILLDECIDWRLARDLPGHDVKSVAAMGWNGIKNGQLLRLAEASFDVFITVDRNLSFQQNLPAMKIAVILLIAKTNRLPDLQPHAPAIVAALNRCQSGQLLTID